MKKILVLLVIITTVIVSMANVDHENSNNQAMGNYKEAERWLWKSVHLLPERIYPYYLLTKLYADPGYNKLDKAREMAQIVLTKEPKVHSQAIQEMRNEVRNFVDLKK